MNVERRRGLIIVDVQNDFISGSLAVGDGEQAAARIADLVARKAPYEAARYDRIVTTQDWHIEPEDHFSDTPDFKDTWPVHCKTGTRGAALSPLLDQVIDRIDARFFKGHYSAAYSGFEGTTVGGHTLAECLHKWGVTEVDVVGIATDYCVKATALDAVTLGFTTTVLLPCTAAVSAAGYDQAVDEMDEAGVNLPV